MTTIKGIPILFQTEMVQAILDGRKTQTRRTKGLEKLTNQYFQSLVHHATGRFTFVEIGNHSPKNEDVMEVKCPYGKPGDLLYVRENWRLYNYDLEEDELTIEYQSGGGNDFSFGEFGYDYLLEWVAKQQFKLEIKGLVEEDPNNPDRVLFIQPIPWSPSIHLPKVLSRLWLMVEEIRVERVQDTSRGDAMEEGCPFPNLNGKAERTDPVDWFCDLFNSINGPESWKSNPWVWVVKFRVLSTTGRPSDEVILQHHTAITGAATADLPSSVSGLPSPITP